MSTIAATSSSSSSLKEDTSKIEESYASTTPKMTKPNNNNNNNNNNVFSTRPHYQGEDIKIISLPPDVKNMVYKGFFALAFFIAILSGTGVGLSIVYNFKVWLLLIVLFILIIILAPDVSDYFIYGVGEYIDLGYTGFKNFTDNMFIKLKNKNAPST